MIVHKRVRERDFAEQRKREKWVREMCVKDGAHKCVRE